MNGKFLGDLIPRMVNAPSRRDVLCGLAGAGMGVGAAWLSSDAEATRQNRRKRKRKSKRKLKTGEPNAFGCLSVGQNCRSDGQCCSGICKGNRGRHTCRAHGTGTCDQQAPALCTGVVSGCNDGVNCVCLVTTAESTACANFSTDAFLCAECRTDADCEALGLPPGSFCAPFSEGFCDQFCEISTACIAPCGLTIPAS